MWNSDHRQALAQSKADFSVLRVLGLQLHQAKVGPVWTQAKVDLPLLSADGRAVQLVVRLDGQLKHLPKAVLQQKILTLLQLWQQQGVKVTQLELDYDCASNWGNWAYIAGALYSAPRSFNALKQALEYDQAAAFTGLLLGKADNGQHRHQPYAQPNWPATQAWTWQQYLEQLQQLPEH